MDMCPHCKTMVFIKSDGYCPHCDALIYANKAGDTHRVQEEVNSADIAYDRKTRDEDEAIISAETPVTLRQARQIQILSSSKADDKGRRFFGTGMLIMDGDHAYIKAVTGMWQDRVWPFICNFFSLMLKDLSREAPTSKTEKLVEFQINAVHTSITRDRFHNVVKVLYEGRKWVIFHLSKESDNKKNTRFQKQMDETMRNASDGNLGWHLWKRRIIVGLFWAVLLGLAFAWILSP